MSLFAWATGSEPSPKAVFQTSRETGIPRLYAERHVPVADHRYWVQFTTLFDSDAEVASMLTVNDLRRAAADAPENLVNLVEVLVMHLESLVDDPEFAPVPQRSAGGFAALLAPRSAAAHRDGRDRAREVLNCCRVISRVVPVVYEALPAGDAPSLEQLVLWTPRARGKAQSTDERAERAGAAAADAPDGERDAQFILTDGDESILSVSPAARSMGLPDEGADAPGRALEAHVTVGHSLLDTLVELLFHSGFTMPWTDEQLATGATDISRVHFTIWEAGIGCPVDLEGTVRAYVVHRVEVMRCLLVLLAKAMYVSAPEQQSTRNIALEHVACELERPAVLAFLCSMLNTISNYRQADGWLPESIVGGDAERNAQASMCAQLLSVLLTCPAPSNLFAFYLAKLYRESDLAFLSGGLGKIFGTCMARTRGAFQISAAGARTFALPVEEHVSELLPVLWVLLRENAQFRRFMVENRAHALHLVAWLLFTALTNKAEYAAQGQMRLAVLLLQDITAERELCVHLSTSGSAAALELPARLVRTQGTLAIDVLIEGVYSLLASGEFTAGLHAPLMATLANTAPYWRNVSVSAAARLEQLLTRCSSPSYLLAAEGNPRVLCILLDALSRVVQYQYSENVQVVYVLVRAHRVFERLRTFDLDAALESLQRARRFLGEEASAPSTSNEEREGTSERENSGGSADAQPGPAEPDSSADTVRVHPAEAEVKGAKAGDAKAEDAKAEDAKEVKGAEEAKEEAKSGEAEAKDAKAGEAKEEAKAGEAKEEPHKSEPKEPEPKESEPKDPEPAPTEPDSTEATPIPEQKSPLPAPLGRSGFIPTHEWVAAWRAALPLAVIDAALAELVPPIEHLCAHEGLANNANADECLLAYLREQNLVGVLPPPVPLEPARVAWNANGEVWLQSYVWGIVYLVGMRPFDTWSETHTRFFDVHIDEPPPTAASYVMQSVAALANAVWQLVPGT